MPEDEVDRSGNSSSTKIDGPIDNTKTATPTVIEQTEHPVSIPKGKKAIYIGVFLLVAAVIIVAVAALNGGD